MKLLLTSLLALVSTVVADVYVFNDCPFPVSYSGDAQSSGPGISVSGTLQPGAVYPESLSVQGRALKFYPTGASPDSLLVFGYTNNDGSPLVWASINNNAGAPFLDHRVLLTGAGNPLDCPTIEWTNGTPGSTKVLACDKTQPLRLTLCAP